MSNHTLTPLTKLRKITYLGVPALVAEHSLRGGKHGLRIIRTSWLADSVGQRELREAGTTNLRVVRGDGRALTFQVFHSEDLLGPTEAQIAAAMDRLAAFDWEAQA